MLNKQSNNTITVSMLKYLNCLQIQIIHNLLVAFVDKMLITYDKYTNFQHNEFAFMAVSSITKAATPKKLAKN